MSEGRSSGCGFLMVILVAMLTIFGITLPEVEDAVRSIVPRQVAVSYAPQEAQMPFTLQNDQIIYTYRKTLDWPCNYIIQGQILDANGKSVTDALINIQIVEDDVLTPLPPERRDPADRRDPDDPSLWVLLLSSYETPYEVWLTDRTGKVISPTIWVNPQDCAHNVANLIFVQTGHTP